MRVVLLGKDGQVGWELQRSLAPLGDVVALGRTGDATRIADLAQPEKLARMVQELRPDIIVNAAAYTAVDKAESEPEPARIVNALAPRELARAARGVGALLVHYSTDYVFDGSGSVPRDEAAPTAPLNVYGRTKLEGEELVRASGCRYVILRTSWVYAARGRNFLKTMLALAAERDTLEVVDDQFGAPTGAELIADVTAHVIRTVAGDATVAGTYHVAAGGETSWYRYALFLIEGARAMGYAVRVPREGVTPVSSEKFATTARRPRNSRLSTDKLQAVFGIVPPPWESGVTRTLTELLGR